MPSVLLEKDEPTDRRLAEVLGASKEAWDALLAHVAELARERPALAPGWKYYGAKHGWQLKVAEKKRSILYLVPGEGSFVAALALDAAGLEALAGLELPAGFVAEVRAAKPGPEGHPARVTVRSEAELRTVRRLLEVKLAPRAKR